MTTTLFDTERIIHRADVPEFLVHGARRIELLDGDMLRLTVCRDLEPQGHGARRSYPVAILNIPLQSHLWNIMAHAQWAFDRGFSLRQAVGPAKLRPSRIFMM
jgi:hypothetical protein